MCGCDMSRMSRFAKNHSPISYLQYLSDFISFPPFLGLFPMLVRPLLYGPDAEATQRSGRAPGRNGIKAGRICPRT